MSIKKSILARVQVAFLAIILLALVIGLQIINIQFIQGADWQRKAEEIGLQYRVKKANRGNIYAENGLFLATSLPLYRLSIDPTIASDSLYGAKVDSLCVLLANFFQDQPRLNYLRKINDARLSRKRYVTLNTRLLTYTEKAQISKWPIVREGSFRGGVLFEKVYERTYPFKNLGVRTIGYINETGDGAGLEISFNKQLAGTDGKALYQRVPGGEWLPLNSGAQIRPIDGYDIYTTIDINIQDVAHQALDETMQKTEATYGCAIVMEVKTGAIKAMVNLGKNKKLDGKFEYIESYNYAIGDQGNTDPGSTFKVASLLALLSDTTLTLQDTIETGGGTFQYYDRIMTDTRAGGWGRLTIQQCLENSSNIGISKLISRHFGKKPDKYIEYIKKFGLSSPLDNNMKMSGMAKPYIKSPQDPTWSGVTMPWMSIGYESKLTPLQMLTFCNAIANDGYLAMPNLVRKVKKADEDMEVFQPQVGKTRIASPAALAKLKTAMEGVVLRGTAKNIKSNRFGIAGKTGTSQKLNARGRYIQKYHASFMGFFPADNPVYSCIVVIDEPKGEDQYGADVCAPVFKQIADRLYDQDINVQSRPMLKREAPLFQTNLPNNQVGFAEDIKQVCDILHIPTMSAQKDELVAPIAGKFEVDWQERKIKPNTIPDVKGLSLRDALYLLENQGLKVLFTGKGRVKTQSMMPGSPLRKGEKIIIQLE
jgi:cell division protein FtsI (penicillin-binding protein 3)